MATKDTQAITARIPQHLLDAVDAIAKLSQRSRNDAVIASLELWIEHESKERERFSALLDETIKRNTRVLDLLAE